MPTTTMRVLYATSSHWPWQENVADQYGRNEPPPRERPWLTFCLQWTKSPTAWKYWSYPHNRRSRWLHSGVSWLFSSQRRNQQDENEPMTMCYVWLIMYTPINDGPIGQKYMYLNVNKGLWLEGKFSPPPPQQKLDSSWTQTLGHNILWE